MVTTIDTLTLGDARRLVMAAEAKAAQIHVPSAIAVVDAGGNLLAFARMDGGVDRVDRDRDPQSVRRARVRPADAGSGMLGAAGKISVRCSEQS